MCGRMMADRAPGQPTNNPKDFGWGHGASSVGPSFINCRPVAMDIAAIDSTP